jgi:S-adenosyl-L-methionine hydrolase (adenosine-forming)
MRRSRRHAALDAVLEGSRSMFPGIRSRLVAGIVGIALLLAWHVGTAAPASSGPRPARPLIVFMTDFGTLDDAVAICKGVMLGIAPGSEIIDLTHQVTPYSIAEGARLLARTAPYYPAGTVFVTVIDPGVGTGRKPIVVKTKRGQYFVLPDNGLVTPVVDRDGLEGAREIQNRDWLLGGSTSSTFHGRDVFAPVAAHLARGENWTRVGPAVTAVARVEVPRPVIEDYGVTGSVVALDGPYGNLVTNIAGDVFRQMGYERGESVRIRVGSVVLTVPFVETFGDVPLGQPLLFLDSRGLLSLAINQGNFARTHGITPPVGLVVYKK